MLSALLVATSAAPAASADPLNSDPAVGDAMTMPLESLGLPDETTLIGANTSQTVTLPVPRGFAVTRLLGLIHSPIDFTSGFVEITDSTGRLLGTVGLPAVIPEQAVVPFDVDISAARVDDSALGLTFTVREGGVSAEQRCGRGEQVLLSDLAALLVGVEPAPATIATFFPPVLRQLTIYTPIDADDAEQQAVLSLTSAVARMYRSQKPTITVVRQARGATPPAAPQLTRAVVVERGDAGLEVVNPDRADVFLRLTGRGDQLTDQTSLVTNQLQSVAQGPGARVDQAGSEGEPDVTEMTFEELDINGESQVLRTSTFTVGVDRAALSDERVDALKVHLLATHTPVADLDSASVMVSVNGQAVHSQPLDSTGQVDTVFDVPGEFLRQRANFEFDLTFSPRQLCSPTIAPMTFQLDPRSTLTVQRGGEPLGGFGAVPSEFSPEFLVAFDGTNPNQLDYATRVVAEIAQQTGSVLTPRVVDVNDAADATTGALIVANSATLEPTSLRPPIGGESTETSVDLRDELRADIAGGLGSIQAFADQPRDRTVILVTTSGAWSLVEPLFGYIDELPDGWASLDGDVLAAGPEGTVTDLSIGPGDAAATPTQDGDTLPDWLVITAACAVLVALVLGAALAWRRRRRAG